MSTGREGIQACLAQADSRLAATLLLEFYDILIEGGKASPLLVLSAIRYTLKHGKDRDPLDGNDHRPITSLGVLTSSLHSIFRLHTQAAIGPSQSDEQFAEKKGFGCDLTAQVISTIIAISKDSPLYIGLIDVKSAYDKSWKEGIWFKMHLKGV